MVMILLIRLLILLFPLSLTTSDDVLPGLQPNTKENLFLLNHGAFSDSPEEISGQFDGDIILNDAQAEAINNGDLFLATRNAIIDGEWPKRIIPYVFSRRFKQTHTKYIRWQMDRIERETCLKFVERKNKEKDYIRITADPIGCASHVGRKGGEQRMNLPGKQINQGCLKSGIILHHLIHSIGFFHEHNAFNRDKYLTIHWDKIVQNKKSFLKKSNKTAEVLLGFEYDYLSVMHSAAHVFAAVKGDITLEPKEKLYLTKMGQRDHMSETDIKKINKLYDCPPK